MTISRRHWRAIAQCCVLLAWSGVASAQVPAGGVITVADQTSGWDPFDGSVATNASSGPIVVIWEGKQGQYPTADYRVFARRFERNGTPLGAELQVSTLGSYNSQVAMGEGGAFLVVWQTVGETGGISGRFYDAAGASVGAEFRVDTDPSRIAKWPRLARLASGDFVVAWSSEDPTYPFVPWGVSARRIDRTGAPVGTELSVATSGRPIHPTVAAAPDGSFMVVWGAFDDENLNTLKTQTFGPDGEPRGPGFAVTPALFLVDRPVAAARGDRGFVLAWKGSHRLRGRLLGPYGQPEGVEFTLAPQSGDGSVGYPSIAADESGAFVVAWEEYESADLVKLRRFTADATPRGSEFTASASDQSQLRALGEVAVDAVGNLAVLWTERFDWTTLARRYGGLYPVASSVDTFAWPLSDGNGVLEPGEAVDLNTSWTNQNGATQTFAGVLTNASGPPGASYTISDPLGDYGTVADGATAPCSDCYGLAVSAPSVRPVLHWDARVDESITPDVLGQHKRWRLHVGDSFTDVPRTSPYYRFVETLLHKGLTGGCGGDAYCPQASTTREQMSALLLVGKEGAGYRPEACVVPVFGDVPASNPFCPFVEELARRGVTSGCGGGNYCPADPVSREQMAVFVLRMLDPALDPPVCITPVFGDVPAASAYCRWIEELARRGIASGCGGENFCPAAPVTREQMAVFLTVTFGLQLYGP